MGQCGQSKTSTSVFDDGKALITPLIEGSIRDVELNGELLIVCSDNGSIKSFNCASVLQGNHVSLNHLTGHSKGVNKVNNLVLNALLIFISFDRLKVAMEFFGLYLGI